MKRQYLVVGAVVVFLLFLGINLPQFLCPVVRWSVGCGVPDRSGTIVMSQGPIVRSEAKQVAAHEAKLGRVCFVTPVRDCLWNRHFF